MKKIPFRGDVFDGNISVENVSLNRYTIDLYPVWQDNSGGSTGDNTHQPSTYTTTAIFGKKKI